MKAKASLLKKDISENKADRQGKDRNEATKTKKPRLNEGQKRQKTNEKQIEAEEKKLDRKSSTAILFNE